MTDWITGHRDLSDLSFTFASYLSGQKNEMDELDLSGLPPLFHQWPLRQRVPLLIGHAFHDSLARDAVVGGELVIEAPRRLARKAPELAAQLYGMQSAAQAVEVLDKNGFYSLESYRVDILRGRDGFKLLEANAGLRSSGFYALQWLDLYRNVPQTATFIEEHGCELNCIDTLEIFVHVHCEAAVQLALVRESGHLGFGVFVEPSQYPEAVRALLEKRITDAAAKMGLNCTLSVFDAPEELAIVKDRLTFRGTPLDVVARFGKGMSISRELYELQLRGTLMIFDTPTSYFSTDKRNFAILTGQRQDGWYDEHEVKQIERLIPWTTMMVPDCVVFDGREWALRDLATNAREMFVLKDARTSGGRGVFVGAKTPPDEWRAKVDACLGSPHWLLQRKCDSFPYILYDREGGFCEHEAVWGYFVIGGRPAGGTIRVKRLQGSNGVINVAAGGTEGIFCLAQ
jgi:hypothetical protein